MIAEFCIRINDAVDPELFPEQYRKLSHAGDVIEIAPKGFCWGDLDLASENHIIISLEVESVEKARNDFMAPEPFDPIRNPKPLRKAVRIDLAQLPGDVITKHNGKKAKKIKDEYAERKASGKPLIFNDDTDSDFKIQSGAGIDPYAVRVVKTAPIASPFIVGEDPFEVI